MTRERLQKKYQALVGEYQLPTKYLSADDDILTEPERALLLDFVVIAKGKSARLRKLLALRRG